MRKIKITKEMIDNFNYVPENMYAEHLNERNYIDDEPPEGYTWYDLMDIANGNEEVAGILYMQCTAPDAWCYPETYHQSNLDAGMYVADADGMYVLNPEYDG